MINEHSQQRHIKLRDQTICTEYVQWCSKYFLGSLNEPSDQSLNQVDVYTTEFLDQHCKILNSNQKQRHRAPAWRDPQVMSETVTLKHTNIPLFCKFHQYEDQLFVADTEANICIYDLVKQQMKFKFSNNATSSLTAKRSSKLTSFKLLNSYYEPYILTATENYAIRLFKADLQHNEAQLITSFSAFNQKEKIQSNIESGLTVDWDDAKNYLLCGGDTRVIRIWDMNKELYTDYNTDVSSGVSCISSNDSYFVAGFGDGKLKLFDLRRHSGSMKTANIINTSFNYEHTSYVMKVQLQKTTDKLISASTNGEINIIDLRNFKMINRVLLSPEVATVVECHPYNELIAM
jgi:WD40 repeat protein